MNGSIKKRKESMRRGNKEWIKEIKDEERKIEEEKVEE